MITCEYCGDPLTLEELPTHSTRCHYWGKRGSAKEDLFDLEKEGAAEVNSGRPTPPPFVNLSMGWVNTSYIIRFGVAVEEEGESFSLTLTVGTFTITELDYIKLLKDVVGGV